MENDDRTEGGIAASLTAAVQSARRLQDHPAHNDTLTHWADLVHQARRELAANGPDQAIQDLVIELEAELARRAI